MARDKRFLSAALLLLVAVVVGVFSYNNAWIGDDMRYMFDYSDGQRSEIVRSFGDVIASQNAHYFQMNGRYVAHVIVQCFCGMWGHLPFAVANAAAYICFFLILFRLCDVRLRNFKTVATVVLLSLFTFQTKMMPSCQVGYIWMFTLTMVFLYLFFRADYHYKWWQLIPVAVFCVVAGNGQEALNLGVSGALIVYWCMNWRKFTIAQYVMMVAFGLGTLIICLSPASQGRMEREANVLSAAGLYTTVYRMLTFLRASYVLLAVTLWKKVVDKQSFGRIYTDNRFLWHVWGIMFVFCLLLGFGSSNRVCLGLELAALIMSVRMLRSRSLSVYILVPLYLLLVGGYWLQWKNIRNNARQLEEIERQYAMSESGVVYLNVSRIHHPVFSSSFIQPIAVRGTDGMPKKDYMVEMKKYLHLRYPGKPDLQIVPERLKGCEKKDLGNRLYETQRDGVYLVVQSKTSPARFYVHRRMIWPLTAKTFPSGEVDFSPEILVAEGEKWIARYVDVEEYIILNLSRQTLDFESDKKVKK